MGVSKYTVKYLMPPMGWQNLTMNDLYQAEIAVIYVNQIQTYLQLWLWKVTRIYLCFVIHASVSHGCGAIHVQFFFQ